MNRIIRSTKFWLLIVVVTAVSAGAAYATIPGGDGVIHGCYAKSGGTLRVVDASVTKCKSGETALTWSQAGVPGRRASRVRLGLPVRRASRGSLAAFLVMRPAALHRRTAAPGSSR
jgi:hypothetical protein